MLQVIHDVADLSTTPDPSRLPVVVVVVSGVVLQNLYGLVIPVLASVVLYRLPPYRRWCEAAMRQLGGVLVKAPRCCSWSVSSVSSCCRGWTGRLWTGCRRRWSRGCRCR
ncbi:MAG: hypothetical protein OXF41_08060 [bacterium]|nr:hypothetical protein [bacterium]